MPATGSRRWIPVLALLGAGAVGYGIWSGSPKDSPTPTPSNAPPSGPSPAPAVGPQPIQADLPLPPVAKVPTPGHIGFPDGTYLPLLNGATGIDKMLFHASQPFTKVVGRVRDSQGREWYVHESGMRSTTYVDSTGRSMALVDAPAPVQPLLPEETGGTGR